MGAAEQGAWWEREYGRSHGAERVTGQYVIVKQMVSSIVILVRQLSLKSPLYPLLLFSHWALRWLQDGRRSGGHYPEGHVIGAGIGLPAGMHGLHSQLVVSCRPRPRHLPKTAGKWWTA